MKDDEKKKEESDPILDYYTKSHIGMQIRNPDSFYGGGGPLRGSFHECPVCNRHHSSVRVSNTSKFFPWIFV